MYLDCKFFEAGVGGVDCTFYTDCVCIKDPDLAQSQEMLLQT